MRLWIKPWLVVGCVSATLAGCQEPKEIIPVAPPGLELSRMPVPKLGEGPQAIGEQATATPSTKQNKVTSSGAGSPPTPIGKPTTTASGLVYETLVEGTGEVARSGQTVTMHYTGTLMTDGKKFDSSRDRGQPFVTPIGVGRVIGGWDEGVPGMKVGERRKLTIPSELGYGAAGNQGIPGNATLVFDVELLGVK